MPNLSDVDVADKLLWALLPGGVSFALGAVWQSWRASSSEIAAQLNDLIKEVRLLEDFATEYWTGTSEAANNKQLEVKIRGTTFAIAAFEEQIDQLFHGRAKQYRHQVDSLFMCCTGGAFETADRVADCPRATETRELAANVAAIIRRSRQESAGLIALLREAIRLISLIPYGFKVLLSRSCDVVLWPLSRTRVVRRAAWRLVCKAISPLPVADD